MTGCIFMPWTGAGGRRGGKQNAALEVSGFLRGAAAPSEKVCSRWEQKERSSSTPELCKATEGKSTETFCIVFFCFWFSGCGAKRAGGNCGGNWGSRLTLRETMRGTKLLHCLLQPAKGSKSVSAVFSNP